MRYVGDFTKNDVARAFFNTRKADGTPITLAGTPVAKAYENASTTEFTGGITLTVDFDGVTGLHLIEADSSNAAYTAGHDYRLILTAGTVDGVSVVGNELMHFSLENRYVNPIVTHLGSMIDQSGGVYFFKLTSIAKILNLVYEGAVTFEDYLRLSASILFNPATGLNTATPKFRDAADSKDRVVDTIVAGARAVVLDPT